MNFGMTGIKLNRIVIQHLDGARKGDLEAFVQSTVTIGRAADCDLVFTNEKSTSSHHAVLRQRDELIEIVDTQSTNGTFVNETRVERAVLKDGDVVRFGVLGPIVKIGLPANRELQTAKDLPVFRLPDTAVPTEISAPFVAVGTEFVSKQISSVRNWRFIRNAAMLYAGGSIAALGAFNTVIDRYKLDIRWFTVFLIIAAGGFISTLVEAWYRGTPGTQKFQWWELAVHTGVALCCFGLALSVWR
jgi:uncharacterized membrane protein